SSQTRALMAIVGWIFCRLNRSKNRHTPTRIPYSCQLQLGTSGRCVMPVGGASTCRAIGLPMSQTSRLTMVQNARRAPPGSLSVGRSTIAEYSARSRGKSGRLEILFLVRFIFRLDVVFGALAIAIRRIFYFARPRPVRRQVRRRVTCSASAGRARLHVGSV